MADEETSTRSQPPAGFETVPLVDVKGCPLAEDVGRRNKSLWLIRIPHNFDASLLSGKTAVINGTQEIPADIEKGIERKYDVLSKSTDASELASFRVLLPSVKTEALCVAQPFSGQMSVIRSLNVPPPVVPSSLISPQRDASSPVSRARETLDDQGKSKRKRTPVDSPPKSVSKSSKSKKREKERDGADEARMDIEPSDVEGRRSKHKKHSHVGEQDIESPDRSHHSTGEKKRKDKREDDVIRAIKEPKEPDLKKTPKKKPLRVVVKTEKATDSEAYSPKKKKKRK